MRSEEGTFLLAPPSYSLDLTVSYGVFSHYVNIHCVPSFRSLRSRVRTLTSPVHSFLAGRDPSVVMSDEYTSKAILSTLWHAINGYSNVHYPTSLDLPTATAVSVPRPRYLPEYQRGSQAHHKDRGQQGQEKRQSLPTGLSAGHEHDHSEAQA
jgi:hypothetical protein